VIVAAAALAGCTEQKGALAEAAKLAPVSFAAIERWGEGHQAEALAAFRRSCEPIARQPPDAAMRRMAPRMSAGEDTAGM